MLLVEYDEDNYDITRQKLDNIKHIKDIINMGYKYNILQNDTISIYFQEDRGYEIQENKYKAVERIIRPLIGTGLIEPKWCVSKSVYENNHILKLFDKERQEDEIDENIYTDIIVIENNLTRKFIDYKLYVNPFIKKYLFELLFYSLEELFKDLSSANIYVDLSQKSIILLLNEDFIYYPSELIESIIALINYMNEEVNKYEKNNHRNN